MSRSIIAWNSLTVADITTIIEHFETQRTHYETEVSLGRTFWGGEIPRIDSLLTFWRAMIVRVEQGQKIAQQVAEFRLSHFASKGH